MASCFVCYLYLFTHTGVQCDSQLTCSCILKVIWRVLLLEQEILTLPEHDYNSGFNWGSWTLCCMSLFDVRPKITPSFGIFKPFVEAVGCGSLQSSIVRPYMLLCGSNLVIHSLVHLNCHLLTYMIYWKY
jgi:hypothetical protein